MSDFVWDYDNPLARSRGESRRANAALCDYEALGPGRSLARLVKGYRGELPQDHPLRSFFVDRAYCGGKPLAMPPSKRLPTVEGWSSGFAWQARLERLAEIRAEEREAVRRARLQALEDADWEEGQALREKVAQLLGEMERFERSRVQETMDANGEKVRVITLKFKPTLGQMSQALKIASELQRLAAGVSTANQRLVDKDGEDLPLVGIEVVAPD